MKKVLSVLLLGLMMVAFAGCDGDKSDGKKDEQKKEQPSGSEKPKDHPAH